MIILDEALGDPVLVRRLCAFWPGRVLRLTDPEIGAPMGLPDSEVPQYLRDHRGCVFVTTNKRDFFGKIEPSARYFILELDLPASKQNDPEEVDRLVRRVLRMDPFRTEAARCGLVAQATLSRVRYYSRLSQWKRAPTISIPSGE